VAAANTIIIFGPTAVGKSELAVKLAKKIGAEIISADSMQVYRGMDIGTAKPTAEEKQGIPHHLIDIRDPNEDWTVSDFIEETNRLIAQPPRKIIAGGTGLYLWSLLEGFSFPIAEADPALREKLKKEPLDKLYQRLKEIDPAAAEKIHANDKKRIVRALEVFELTGKPISKVQEEARPRGSVSGFPHILIGLSLPREVLYKKIEERIDQMAKNGLIEEVKGLLANGCSKDLKSFQALGYKEVCEYLDGKWSKEEMVAELKKRTRNFSKRQMTWLKRFKDVKWFSPPVDSREILDYINDI